MELKTEEEIKQMIKIFDLLASLTHSNDDYIAKDPCICREWENHIFYINDDMCRLLMFVSFHFNFKLFNRSIDLIFVQFHFEGKKPSPIHFTSYMTTLNNTTTIRQTTIHLPIFI